MDTIEHIAQTALRRLHDAGAQEAQVYLSAGEKTEFNVDGGQFSLYRSLFNNQLHLTAFVDHKKGAVMINDLTSASLDRAVDEAMTAARSGMADDAYGTAEQPYHGTFTLGVPDGDRDRLFDRTAELLDDIRTRYPTILMEQLIVSHARRRMVFLNSHGVRWLTTEGDYGLSAMFSAHEGTHTSSFNGAGFVCDHLDRPFLEMGSLQSSLEATVQQVYTRPVTGKFLGTVLLTPDCFGSLLHRAFGNFIHDGSLIDGTSPWRDALGTRVADPRLTVSSAPLDPRMVCGERYVPAGYPCENTDIIREGVLQRFLLSRYGALKTGHDRAPTSGGNLIVAPGDTSLDDLIAGIDHGLLVGRLSGGHPGTNGDFSGVAKNSFLISHGRIDHAVSETMISGNLADLLLQLEGLSRETVEDGASVLPWAAFRGVTVSGN